MVGLDDPPLRLPLGAAAFDRIREQLTGRLAELDAVEALGRDTDFDSGRRTDTTDGKVTKSVQSWSENQKGATLSCEFHSLLIG